MVNSDFQEGRTKGSDAGIVCKIRKQTGSYIPCSFRAEKKVLFHTHSKIRRNLFSARKLQDSSTYFSGPDTHFHLPVSSKRKHQLLHLPTSWEIVLRKNSP
ncbi:Protein of unknown function [Gryllus bimaculatus]|nr:Protein of unknown function [Gryllus bimaculatus]